MIQFDSEAMKFADAEEMAAAYLSGYFDNREIVFPVDPFQMLKAEGVLFSLMNFKKLEGVYIMTFFLSLPKLIKRFVNILIVAQKY